MRGIIKADRAASVEEAEALQACGATIVGINLQRDPRFEDDRFVDTAAGLAIREALTRTALCVALDPGAESAETAIEAAMRLRPDYLQVPRYGVARQAWRDAILATGLPIVLDGEEASYEDEPGWLQGSLAEAKAWGATLIQFELLNDMEAPWQFLQERAPQEPDDLLQESEIAALVARYPVLVGMELMADEVTAFQSAFGAAQGIFFRFVGKETKTVLELVRQAVAHGAAP